MKNFIFWLIILVVMAVVLFGLIKVGLIVVPNISQIGCQPTCEQVHR